MSFLKKYIYYIGIITILLNCSKKFNQKYVNNSNSINNKNINTNTQLIYNYNNKSNGSYFFKSKKSLQNTIPNSEYISNSFTSLSIFRKLFWSSLLFSGVYSQSFFNLLSTDPDLNSVGFDPESFSTKSAAIFETEDGNITVSLQITFDDKPDSPELYIFKSTGDGTNILWDFRVDISENDDFFSQRTLISEDYSIYFLIQTVRLLFPANQTNLPDNIKNAVLGKVNSNGTLEAIKIYGFNDTIDDSYLSMEPRSITFFEDDIIALNVIKNPNITAQTFDQWVPIFAFFSQDLLILEKTLRINPIVNLSNTEPYDEYNDILTLDDGNILVCGRSTFDRSIGDNIPLLVNFDKDFNNTSRSKWGKNFNVTDTNEFSDPSTIRWTSLRINEFKNTNNILIYGILIEGNDENYPWFSILTKDGNHIISSYLRHTSRIIDSVILENNDFVLLANDHDKPNILNFLTLFDSNGKQKKTVRVSPSITKNMILSIGKSNNALLYTGRNFDRDDIPIYGKLPNDLDDSSDLCLLNLTETLVWQNFTIGLYDRNFTLDNFNLSFDDSPHVVGNITTTISKTFCEETFDPTNDPTNDPTSDPTDDPTNDSTIDPTNDPTSDPTNDPTNDPTIDPTNDPTNDPTIDPTNDPTNDPTIDPTIDPTNDPTIDPTIDPTNDPTNDPTIDPTNDPTNNPTMNTQNPTNYPTTDPTFFPAKHPTKEKDTYLGLILPLSITAAAVCCYCILFWIWYYRTLDDIYNSGINEVAFVRQSSQEIEMT
ncbi:MAG: hypothetical protein GY830_09980 [Bacteroidetes bacterium]|nr:hypothetical protein [Bacteroidota bacterium]